MKWAPSGPGLKTYLYKLGNVWRVDNRGMMWKYAWVMPHPYLRAIFVCEKFLKIKVFYLGLHCLFYSIYLFTLTKLLHSSSIY